MERLIRTVIVPLAAVAAGLLIGMLFLWGAGYPSLSTFKSIVTACFNDWYGFGQVLRTTSLLTFTGLAVAIAFHAGLFNIGAEGQLYIGAIVLGIAGFYVKGMPKETVADIPWTYFALGAIALAMLCAAAWGAIPGILKAYTGAHEVISTIMMNFIAFSLVNYLLRPGGKSFASPGRMQTPPIPKSTRIPRVSEHFAQFEGSTLNYASVLAVVAAIGIWVVLSFTRLGFNIRAVGKNPEAARAAGISPGRTIVIAMAISGALAGLVGVEFVMGNKGYFEEGFSADTGFLGIAVALLANNHPIGVIFTAFLFGVLNYGKVAAAGEVPKDIIEIMQAAIILSVILGNKLFAMWLIRMRKRRAATPVPLPQDLDLPAEAPAN